MAVRFLIRRGTAAQWAAAGTVLAAGELGYETDTGVLKVGNGTLAWGTLPALGSGTSNLLEVNGGEPDSTFLQAIDGEEI